MAIETVLEKSIPIINKFSWEMVKTIKIKESHERLIPLSYIPEKIIVRPQYFIQGIKGAIPECFIRESAYNRLFKATDYLPKGYKLLIFDAWRPASVQKALYEKLEKEIKQKHPDFNKKEIYNQVEEYVALPSTDKDSPSPHLTGGAVDLTIIDENGKILEMGTKFDETVDQTHTDYFERLNKKRKLNKKEKLILKNRRLLFNTMSAAGFINYPHEWWHFDYGDQLWACLSDEVKYAIYGISSPELRWKLTY